AGRGLVRVLRNAGDPEWRAVFHCDSVGLLRLLPFDRFPFKETVHRHDAAALAVRIPKRRQSPHSLILCVDRLAATRRVLAPIRDQTPAKRIERDFTILMIAADDEQLLAWRSVPSWRINLHATVAHVHAIDDGITKRSAALDDPPTHGSDIVIYQRSREVGLARLCSPIPKWKPHYTGSLELALDMLGLTLTQSTPNTAVGPPRR